MHARGKVLAAKRTAWKLPGRVNNFCTNTHATPTTSSSTNKTMGVVFFSSICLTALGLGVWQTKRYFWKVGLIEEAAQRYARDDIGSKTVPSPVLNASYSALATHMRGLEGQKICLQGEFLHDREVLVGPRAAPPGLVGAAAQGMATNPMGFYIYTPFQLKDGGHTVFVNRGWVSKNAMEGKGNATIRRPDGPQRLEQLVVGKGEPKNRFTPTNDQQSLRTKTLLWVQPAALEAAAGLRVTTASPRPSQDNDADKGAHADASTSSSGSSWWWGQSANVDANRTELARGEEKATAAEKKEEEQVLQQLQTATALSDDPLLAPVEAVIVEVIDADDAIVDSYPVARRYKQLTEFSVAPVTHLTYAVTWFSLSAAGIFMTHRLFKGKGKGVTRGGKNVV